MASHWKRHIPEYGTPDDENPEWTAEDFARARPAREVLTELFGAAATDRFLAENRRRIGQRGRQKAPVKQRVTLCVDADVVAAFRGTGRGWQTRMNQALRQGMPQA
jgi:uncharacterized protein (DUF4415 family)